MIDADDLIAACGRTIREIRLERRLSQGDLQRRTGINRNYIGDIERGQRNPSLRQFAYLTNALDIPFDEFITRALSTRGGS